MSISAAFNSRLELYTAVPCCRGGAGCASAPAAPTVGRLTGQSSGAVVYSLRDSATVDYAAPSLTLTKTASPADANTDDETVYVPGWPRAATLAVKGAPALANLDAHPALRWWRPT